MLSLDQLEMLTPENVSLLRQIGLLGRGTASAIAWKPTGETLVVAGTTGIWSFNANFNQVDHWTGSYNAVRMLAWSPDGERLAVLENDNLIVFRSDGSVLFENTEPISSFSWHPFDAVIATGSEDQTVRILNADTSELIRETSSAGENVAWSPDGTRLAVSGQAVGVLDTNNLEPLLTIREKQAGGAVQWSYDGSLLSSGCFDEETFSDFDGTCLWDVESGNLISSTELASIVWSSDVNLRIYYGSSPFAAQAGSFLLIEQPDTPEPVQSGYWEQLHSLIWHPIYNRLTGLTFDGTLVEFAVPSGEIEGQHLLYTTTVNAISINPNSQTVATTREGIVQIWDLAAGASNFIDEPAINFDTDRGTYTHAFVDVTWINSDEFITIETTYSDYDSSVSRSISRRNAKTGDENEQIYRYEGDYDAASPEYNCGSHPSWDYSRFACAVGNDLRMYTFDLRTILLSIPMDHIRDIEWGPDNTVLALRRYIEATTSYIIEIRRVSDGDLLYTVDADGRHTPLVWNYDLGLVAIPVSMDGNPSIQIVNTQTYEVVDTIVAEQALWHPTDNLLALSDDTSLKFWTPSASTLNAEVGISGITAFDWSDSGQFIVTAGNDGTIRLWGVPRSE